MYGKPYGRPDNLGNPNHGQCADAGFGKTTGRHRQREVTGTKKLAYFVDGVLCSLLIANCSLFQHCHAAFLRGGL